MPDVPTIIFRFTAGEGEAAGHIPLPVDPRTLFGRARAQVVVKLGGYTYRSTVAIMTGETFVPFRASHRDAAGVRPGDTVEVTLTLDTAPRTVDIPPDLAEALDAAGLRIAWDRLGYTRQREQADAVEGAKRPDTRTRRIAATVDRLRG
jgi:hypothetical protein